ncbi:hypothetical protein JOF53_000129 [Crossiella equi]|uniref:Uncharacterized protein n=1 Tax=Crossiella equi TaxID=130796 RepID=A0ABS5A4T4_9PSEU|nr:hypothetical protein [Crossiella equi]
MQWSGGPDRPQMRAMAEEYSEEVEELDLDQLVWQRSSG